MTYLKLNLLFLPLFTFDIWNSLASDRYASLILWLLCLDFFLSVVSWSHIIYKEYQLFIFAFIVVSYLIFQPHLKFFIAC